MYHDRPVLLLPYIKREVLLGDLTLSILDDANAANLGLNYIDMLHYTSLKQ
jgi:hypothetical protein